MNIWDETCEQAIQALALANNKDKKYLIVVNCFKKAIESGTIPQATPLLAQRKLGKQLNLTLATINRIYQQLAIEGLIISHPGKGSYTKTPNEESTIQSEPQSNTPPLNNQASYSINQVKHSITEPIIDDSYILDTRFESPMQSENFKLNNTNQINVNYALNITDHIHEFLESSNCSTTKANTYLSQSFYHALKLVIENLLSPSDTIMCFELTHPAISHIATENNFNIKGISFKDGQPDLSVIEQYCKIYQPKVFVFGGGTHNPTGFKFTQKQIEEISDICNKYDVKIIEDISFNWIDSNSLSFSSITPTNCFSICSISNFSQDDSKTCLLQIPASFAFEFELQLSQQNPINHKKVINQILSLQKSIHNLKEEIENRKDKIVQAINNEPSLSESCTITPMFLWINCSTTQKSNYLKMLLGTQRVLSLNDESFNTEQEYIWNRRVQTQNKFGVRIYFGHLQNNEVDHLLTTLVQSFTQFQLSDSKTYNNQKEPSYLSAS